MCEIISVQDVTKVYGKQQVLKNVFLSCVEGRIYGLVGRNGSGKTVLLKCICGIVQPNSGEISVWGKRIGKDVDFPDNIGFIIETPGFLPHESGLSNLKHLASIQRKIGLQEIRESMELVGLDPDLKKAVGKETMLDILKALAQCTENQRRRFLLYALEGLSYAEIGRLCGCSKVAVHYSIEAVRKKCKEFLTD